MLKGELVGGQRPCCSLLTLPTSTKQAWKLQETGTQDLTRISTPKQKTKLTKLTARD